MAKHEEKFVNGAVGRGIQEDKAQRIFTLMAQFADYGFNRSHSFAYAYLAYQTAYLKAHHPTHFYAAVLSDEIANTAKLARYIGEMKTFEMDFCPRCEFQPRGFTPEWEGHQVQAGRYRGWDHFRRADDHQRRARRAAHSARSTISLGA